MEVGGCGDSGGMDIAADCINCGRPHATPSVSYTGDTYWGEATTKIWQRTREMEAADKEDL